MRNGNISSRDVWLLVSILLETEDESKEKGETMISTLGKAALCFFAAGVLVTAHADEPLKVDTRGVTAKVLYEAPIDGGHLPELKGKYKMRITEITIAPGGHVGDHNHLGPGIRQMTVGEMEYILPDKTMIYRAGDFFFETGDVSHRTGMMTLCLTVALSLIGTSTPHLARAQAPAPTGAPSTLVGRVIVVGIPGAGALSPVGTFHPGGPIHDKPAFAAFTRSGAVTAYLASLPPPVVAASLVGTDAGHLQPYAPYCRQHAPPDFWSARPLVYCGLHRFGRDAQSRDLASHASPVLTGSESLVDHGGYGSRRLGDTVPDCAPRWGHDSPHCCALVAGTRAVEHRLDV
jgi:quercetin dioxygenase-like cupin family protein